MGNARGPDVNLAAAVDRARARAAALGELRPPTIGPIESVFTDEARTIVEDWKRDGGYARALEAIADDCPDIAVQ